MRIITTLNQERWYPLIVALMLAVAFYLSPICFPKGEGILSAGLTMGAIFTAFIATNKSVILTLDTRIMKKMRDGPYYDTLISYLRSALWSSFFFSVFCLALYFFELSKNRFLSAVWIGCVSHMILTFHRVTRVLLCVIDDKNNRKDLR